MSSNLNQGAWNGSQLPRQRLVIFHTGGAVTPYRTAYDNDQACDALIDCHRRYPDATIEAVDAASFADEQEGCI